MCYGYIRFMIFCYRLSITRIEPKGRTVILQVSENHTEYKPGKNIGQDMSFRFIHSRGSGVLSSLADMQI